MVEAGSPNSATVIKDLVDRFFAETIFSPFFQERYIFIRVARRGKGSGISTIIKGHDDLGFF